MERYRIVSTTAKGDVVTTPNQRGVWETNNPAELPAWKSLIEARLSFLRVPETPVFAQVFDQELEDWVPCDLDGQRETSCAP